MSLIKLSVLTVFGLILIATALGVPLESKSEKELVKSFAEFLNQDKELSAAIENAHFGQAPVIHRAKRQEIDEDDLMPPQGLEKPNNTEGFFDRAAKFVMEVLQRFLKWVNTDN